MENKELKLKKDLILGSSSQRRKDILKTLGINFKCIIPEVNENKLKDESPSKYVKRISKKKSNSIWNSLNINQKTNSVLLTSDTIVTLKVNNKWEIIGKPLSTKKAIKTLKTLSGKTHNVITAFTLKTNKKVLTKTVTTKVLFRKLTDKEIIHYAEKKECLDKAGAYAIQGKGSFFVSQIEGSFTNVVGLPVEKLLIELKKL
jgi:septum formation protein